jgi:class 3 adenylate cyclase
VNQAKERDVAVRAGVHTGECEVVGEKLAGISVVTGARVAALANADEVLVPNSQGPRGRFGIRLHGRGTHELKGVPGDWRVYSVATAT